VTLVPFDVQLIQDTGIPGVQVAESVEGDNATDILITAAANVNGIQLWAISLSSYCGGGTTPVDDAIQDSAAVEYISLENGPNNSANTSLEMKGIVVPAGRSLNLVSGNAGGTHKFAGTVIFTLL
jgi:hypothetical protein